MLRPLGELGPPGAVPSALAGEGTLECAVRGRQGHGKVLVSNQS